MDEKQNTEAEPKVVKIGRKWHGIIAGEVVTEQVKTKAEAEAALAAEVTRREQATTMTPEFIAAMNPVDRIAVAKAEVAAKKAGLQTATPVYDWMTAVKASGGKTTTKAGSPAPKRSAEQMEQLLDIIRAGRAATPKLSYGAIGKQLDEAGIAPARAATWDYAVVASLAHKHGIEEAIARKAAAPVLSEAEVAELDALVTESAEVAA